jgi:hypothetical protein
VEAYGLRVISENDWVKGLYSIKEYKNSIPAKLT